MARLMWLIGLLNVGPKGGPIDEVSLYKCEKGVAFVNY